MAALRDLARPEAELIATEGYYREQDGGGGLYFWHKQSLAMDNSGTIIRPNGIAPNEPGRWHLVLAQHQAPSLRQFGLRADDPAAATDNLARFDAAKYASRRLFFGEGRIYFSGSLEVPDDEVEWYGLGPDATVLHFPAGLEHYILAEERNGVRLRNFATAQKGRADRGIGSAVHFQRCRDSSVENLTIHDVEDIGCWFVDCDACTVRGVTVRTTDMQVYRAEKGARVITFDGCSNCIAERCQGYCCHFAYVVTANDGLGARGNQSVSRRARTDAVSNQLVKCTVDKFTGHAFTFNAVDNCSVRGFVARDYEGREGQRGAFQNKAKTSKEASGNVFSGITGYNVGSGIYSQHGSKLLAEDIKLDGVNYYAAWFNAAPGCQLSNMIVRRLRGSAVRVERSHGCQIDGVKSEAVATIGTKLIEVVNSRGTSFDNVTADNQHEIAIAIDAQSTGTKIGSNCWIGDGAIVDENPTTNYPLRYEAVVNIARRDTFRLGSPDRGLWIARIRMTCIEAVEGGTPAVLVDDTNGEAVISMTPVPARLREQVVIQVRSPRQCFRTPLKGRCEGGAAKGRVVVIVDGLACF